MTDSNAEPRAGRGAFQWNKGGWVGSVGGGLAWLVPSIFFLFAHSEWTAGGVAAIATTVSTALGTYLWRQRRTLDPFHGMMIMGCSFAVTNTAAWLAIGLLASPTVLDKMRWPASRIGSAVGVFLFIVAFIVWFYFLEQRARRTSDAKN